MLKGINDILKYIIIENFHNITVFIVFLVYQQKKTARYDGQSRGWISGIVRCFERFFHQVWKSLNKAWQYLF